MDPPEGAGSLPASFVSFFRSLPSSPRGVRFFNRKDYYTCHGEDAMYVARTFYKTTSVVKYAGGGANPLPGVNLNRSLFESVLRELLVESADHTVEIYETCAGSPGWRLARSASPGNLAALEDVLFRSTDMAETPVVMAAAVAELEGQKVVGLAFADSGRRALYACEFADDDQLCTLESVVVQVGARECVVQEAPSSASSSSGAAGTAPPPPDRRKLMDVMSRCGVLVSERGRRSFDARNIESDLARLLASGNVERHRDVLDQPAAAQALAALVSFAEYTADADSLGKWNLEMHRTCLFMRLDAAAMSALHVMPLRGDANASFSIYGLLCRARTPMGKRLLRAWLKQPLLDVAEIGVRHDVVEAMVRDSVMRESARSAVRGMPDVERLARKLDRGRIDLASLCQLYRASGQLAVLAGSLRHVRSPGADGDGHGELLGRRYAAPLEDARGEERLGRFEALIEAAVDLDAAPEEYLVRSSYSAELGELAGRRRDVLAEIEAEAAGIGAHLGMAVGKQLKLERSNHLGHYLRITKKEEAAVRRKMEGRYYQIEAKKDGIKFVSNKLRRLSDSYAALSAEYAGVQAEVVSKVVSVAQGYTALFEQAAGIVAELDVLVGFAEVALGAPLPYARPEMLPMGEGGILLEESRHPCVEAQGVPFIANDCRMERGSSWFQTITGPNMGGKSTFIRQVGACVLMAQVGAFVPCASAKISVRDAIFARVGAGDCQIRGVSTFMAEMLETAVILRAATADSLIIVDELGRGTSTYDGFGLAWAISEHIITRVGAPCLFATHFHELTRLDAAEGCGAAANFHVQTAIDPNTKKLTMLYRVLPGACDQSFGIHVAEFANFPPEVVQMAREKAAELEDFDSQPQDEGGQAGSGGEPGSKRKRVDARPGAERALRLLRDFRALPVPSLPEGEALARTRALVAEFEADTRDCEWIREAFFSAEEA